MPVLRPFQEYGARWLRSKTGAILADDMGLGKTAQAVMAINPEAPTLVVAPAYLKYNWEDEIEMWRPGSRVSVINGRKNFRWPEPGEIVIANYELLPPPGRKTIPRGMLTIADEAHALKNLRAQRSIKFRYISQVAKSQGGSTWLLTGTPVMNQPDELWSLLVSNQTDSITFGKATRFRDSFNLKTKMVRMGNGEMVPVEVWGEPDSTVRKRLAEVMLRRTKDQVLKELPAKQHRWIRVPLDDKKLRQQLDEAMAEMESDGIDIEKAIMMAKSTKDLQLAIFALARVRGALATAKIPPMLDIIHQYEEARVPLVVFSAHRAPIDALRNRQGWHVITGDMSARARRDAVSRFQAGEGHGIAATIKAGGTGLTMTRASHALFIDMEWTPALNAQAEDRIHRIGQHDGVMIHRLVVDHGVDSRVMRALARKQETINNVMGHDYSHGQTQGS